MKLILLLIIPIIGLGQDFTNESYVSRNNLKGSIKSIEYLDCEIYQKKGINSSIKNNYKERLIFEDNQLISFFVYDTLNRPEHTVKFRYDKIGRKEEVIETDYWKGEVSDCNKKRFEYNQEGYIAKEIISCCDNNFPCPNNSVYEYYYNELGIRVKTIVYNSDGEKKNESTRKFEKATNTIVEQGENSEYKSIYKYDSQGRKVETIKYFSKDINAHYLHKFREDGNLIEQRSYSNHKSNQKEKYIGKWKWVLLYDEENNCIEANGSNNIGEVEMINYRYKFDEMRNWVSREKFVNGEYVQKIVREIEYE